MPAGATRLTAELVTVPGSRIGAEALVKDHWFVIGRLNQLFVPPKIGQIVASHDGGTVKSQGVVKRASRKLTSIQVASCP